MTFEAIFDDSTVILAWIGIVSLAWTIFAGVFVVLSSHREHSHTLWRITRHSVLFRIPAREELESVDQMSFGKAMVNPLAMGAATAGFDPILGKLSPRWPMTPQVLPETDYFVDPRTGEFTPPKDQEENNS